MRERLLRFLRVPPRPHLPATEPDSVRVFKAAPGWLMYQRITWAFKQGGALIGLLIGLYWFNELPEILPAVIELGPVEIGRGTTRTILYLIEAGAWAGYLAQAAGTLLLLRLDWEQRWYLVSDRSLRVREGLVRLHEKTTTFENIQNVTIRQGPLQRILGIADLEVTSAGGGGAKEDDGKSGDDLHTVRFRGVTDAPGIRDTILRRVQRVREARGERPEATRAESALDRLTAAARALREQARGLTYPGGASLPPGDPAGA